MMTRRRLDLRHVATVVQPPDEGGEGDVWNDILKSGPAMNEATERACEARRDFGIGKHGRPLALIGGTRSPDIDLVQELLDGVAYAWRGGRRDTARRLLAEIGWVLDDMERKAPPRAADPP